MNRSSNSKNTSHLMVFSLAFGCIIGWGAFVMPGTALLPKAGIWGVIFGILLAGFFALIICLNYIVLAKSYPEANSSYRIVKSIFGMDHAYFMVWSLLLAYVSVFWVNASSVAYVGRFLFGERYSGTPGYKVMGYEVYLGDILAAMLLIYLAGIIVRLGFKTTMRVISVLSTVLFLSIIILFFGVVLNTDSSVLFSPSFSTATTMSRQAQVMSIAVIAPWLFVGFEVVSHTVTETKLPLRMAFITSACAIVAGICSYIMLALIINAGVPDGFRTWEDYAITSGGINTFSDIPAFNSVNRIMGSKGVILLIVAFLCALLSTVLGFMMVALRTIKLMADDGLAPASLGKVSDRGVPKNALAVLITLSIPMFFAGRNMIGWAVDISTLTIAIVYGYISIGAMLSNGDKFGFRISGAVGALCSFGIFIALMLPGILDSALAKEDYLIMAVWSMFGLICYRYVLAMDKEHRLGKSMLMWLLMFFLLFYASNMWMSMQMEDDIQRNNDTADLSEIFTTESLISTLVVIIALIILFELFGIMLKRERELDRKIDFAREKDRTKNNLLASMSHDIRTPLNAIVGFSDLALQDTENNEKMVDYMEKIRTSGSHLLTLINDVLDMSRIESGKFELKPEPVNLPELFAYIRKTTKRRADFKEVFFDLDVRTLENENVICDRNRLIQIFVYLITSAARYTPIGGEVMMGATQLSTNEDGRAMYEFYVKDNGTGLSHELVSRINDNTSDEEKYTTADSQGRIMGMVLTRRIVELMGGHFEIESEEGKGTQIYISFELEICDTPVKKRAENEDILRGKRALVVDDIMVNRQIAVAMINMYGMEAEEAKDGQEALERMSSVLPGHYDLILMDIQMPRLNGFAASRKIRELSDPINSSVPILAMTANVFDEDRDKAFEAGMNGFVPKPVDREFLIQTITEVFNKQDKGE